MQVFKAYFKIVKRRLSSVVIYFIIFIALAAGLTLLGGKKEEDSFTQTSLDIAVNNQDEGELGAALVEYLSESNEVTQTPESEDELLDAVFYRELDYVLYIPQDFTERFLAGEREGLLVDKKVPSSTTGAFGDNQIESYLTTVGLFLEGGFSLEESIARTEENQTLSADVEFMDKEGAKEKPAAAYYYQYLAYIFICTMIMLIGPLLLAFNKKDINARNKCSSMPFFVRNMQLLGASVVVLLVEFAVLMAVGVVLYPDYAFSVKGAFSMLNGFAMDLVAMALAYFSAQIIKKPTALDIVSNTFGLGFAFLGGVFVPMEMFRSGLLVVSRFTPTYWYVTANDAIAQMTEVSEVLGIIRQSVIIQLVYALALLSVGLLLNRMKARE